MPGFKEPWSVQYKAGEETESFKTRVGSDGPSRRNDHFLYNNKFAQVLEPPAHYNVLGSIQSLVEATDRLKGLACTENEAPRCEAKQSLKPQPQPCQRAPI
jgi:hypothetical protein